MLSGNLEANRSFKRSEAFLWPPRKDQRHAKSSVRAREVGIYSQRLLSLGAHTFMVAAQHQCFGEECMSLCIGAVKRYHLMGQCIGRALRFAQIASVK